MKPIYRRLEVFDFDGTLFRSPDPPSTVDPRGWWSDPASLSPPNVPAAPGEEWWNPWEVEEMRRALITPSTKVVVITGRTGNLTDRLRSLLITKGIEPHEAYLHPGTGGTVKEWKCEVLKKLLTPWVTEVHLYEDNWENLTAMRRLAEASAPLRSVYAHLSTGQRRMLATKTPGEREDEAAAELVRPSPKKKPPRKDLRENKMDLGDPDMSKDDPDMSLNSKRVAGQPIAHGLVGDSMTNKKKASLAGVRRLTAHMDKLATAIETHQGILGIPGHVATDLLTRLDFVSGAIEKTAGFKPADIGKKVPGPIEAPAASPAKGHFTQGDLSEVKKLVTAASNSARAASLLAPKARRAAVYARVRRAFLDAVKVAEEGETEEVEETEVEEETEGTEGSDDFGLYS